MPILSKASSDEFDSPVERLLASIANLLQQPTSKGAHFYRTSLRRFEAWCEVFHPPLDSRQKEALKFLEKLRRCTGKLRDTEVHLDLLAQLAEGDASEKKKLDKALQSRSSAYERKLRWLVRKPILTGIWRTLRALDEPPPETHEMATFHPIAGMTTLALDEYHSLVQRHGRVSAENLHQYRLECKRFRYTAELADKTPERDKLIETWKNVQDIIGEWHDYLTLSELAEIELGDSSVLTLLQQITKRKYAQARRAVSNCERKLIPLRIAKKTPQRTTANRRQRVA